MVYAYDKATDKFWNVLLYGIVLFTASLMQFASEWQSSIIGIHVQ